MKFAGVYSTEEFSAILSRERERADRNRHGFSVVVVDLFGRKASRGYARFCKLVLQRMRTYDALGWYAPGRIGILMPDTPELQAAVFAEKLCAACEKPDIQVSFSVVVYPDYWKAGSAEEADMQRLPHRAGAADLHNAVTHCRVEPKYPETLRERAVSMWARLF